jgi:hypothetical protein
MPPFAIGSPEESRSVPKVGECRLGRRYGAVDRGTRMISAANLVDGVSE